MEKTSLDDITQLHYYIDKITESHVRNHIAQKEYCDALLKHAKAIQSPYGVAFALTYLSEYYLGVGEYKKSLSLIEKVIIVNQGERYYQLLMKSYNIRAIISNINHEFYLAMEDFINALAIAEELGNYEMMWTSNNNIGCIFYCLNDFKEAKRYFLKANQISEKLPNMMTNLRYFAFSRTNMADCYARLQMYDDALNLINELDKYLEYTNYLPAILVVLTSKIYVYYQINRQEEAFVLMDELILKAEEITEEISSLSVKFVELTQFAMENHDEVRAMKLIRLLEKMARMVEDVFLQGQLIEIKIEFNECFGYDNAIEYEKYYFNKREIDQAAAKLRNASLIRIIKDGEMTRENASKSEANQILEALSKMDELTQLPNRRSMNERLREYFVSSKKDQKKLCLMIADLDYFKQYNDLFGHLAGDELLRKVSMILKNRSSNQFYPTRYGGDEFVILGFDKTSDEIMRYIKDVVADITKFNIEYEVTGHNVRLNLSFGIYNDIPGETESDCNNLIGYADVDLYDEKKLKKSKIHRDFK